MSLDNILSNKSNAFLPISNKRVKAFVSFFDSVNASFQYPLLVMFMFDLYLSIYRSMNFAYYRGTLWNCKELTFGHLYNTYHIT